MTTLAMISRNGNKDIIHLIDNIGARSRCGSFSAWGTSNHSDRTAPLDFIDLERADVNGQICGRCLMGLDIKYSRAWKGGEEPYEPGQEVEDMDELVKALNTAESGEDYRCPL